MLGATELIIILIAVGILIFGNKKRAGEFAQSLGKFTAEFKKGKKEVEKEIEGIKKELR